MSKPSEIHHLLEFVNLNKQRRTFDEWKTNKHEELKRKWEQDRIARSDKASALFLANAHNWTLWIE